MPGDAVIPDPTHVETQALTVDAPPHDIWPWLVQIGSRRGGLYRHDWLDRLFGFLDQPSANRILPEFQHLAVGDRIECGREYLTVAARGCDGMRDQFWIRERRQFDERHAQARCRAGFQ